MKIKDSKKQIERLKTYSKKDIIWALDRYYQSGYVVAHILKELEWKACQNMLYKHEKLYDSFMKAQDAYFQWRHEMCLKYGDGVSVKLLDIPTEEIERGAILETALNQAMKAEKECNKRLDNLLRLKRRENEKLRN